MSFDAITNRGEYLSAHYLAEVLPDTLKRGLLKRWTEEQKAGRVTPRAGVRGYRADYFNRKAEIADEAVVDPELLRKHHEELLRALGYEPARRTLTVERNGNEYQIAVAHAEVGTAHGIIALDCGWAADTDAAHDLDDAGRLLDPLILDGSETIASGPKLASWLFGIDNPPRYVLLFNGGVITLADRTVWGEGRYLGVNLDLAYGRNKEMELDVFAALFGADSLRPPAEGGAEPLADLVSGSRQHAVGVSSELREGLRHSVELIANEVLDRIREAGYQPDQVMDLGELGKELGREALRYLYRILFLLYAEARPELGVLPVTDPEYLDGYSLARLGDLVARRLDPATLRNFHLYESLDLLFTMVNEGHRERGGAKAEESENEGLRFEPMRSNLFLPEAIKLIGRGAIPEPGNDPDDPDAPKIDTRLRDSTLYQVLRLLMITKGDKRKRGGFISYAQLGINQLGAVYEGLMSYTGFVATEPLYEVARNGDAKDGSWMIPASKADEYDDLVFVSREHPITGIRSRVSYDAGQFVYRLAGRDRQTSASYYTPQSLTEVTVQLALKYRLDQAGTKTKARELLDWTICEPALGSGAFLNEAINQVAGEYLRRRQEELEFALDPEQYHLELQRVKAYIALHNCYGVDLNRTAVELAEVSLWLNVMHPGLQAPWFGLHLRRGNSLIGGRRQVYTAKQVTDKSWLTEAPTDAPFRDGAIPNGSIHHFLLPADGWGAVAGEREARDLAPAETEALKKWRSRLKTKPSPKQVKRLQALACRIDYLWGLVQRRLTISEEEIRRDIPVWQAEKLPLVPGVVPRDKVLKDLEDPGTPYWRLKTLMDAWCALWFWPLQATSLLDGTADTYGVKAPEVVREGTVDMYEESMVFVTQDLFGADAPQQLALPKRVGKQRITVTEHLTRQTPLGDLDDWLSFVEALVGRGDLETGTLLDQAETLTELDDHEALLVLGMGMDEPFRLGERFPWLDVAVKIADEKGFFHWELTFAQAFAAPKGGFDLQVGNPPWVRPRWMEDAVLAESEPWFRLADKPSVEQWRERKSALLSSTITRNYFLREMTENVGSVSYLGNAVTYPVLVGTQPDLYRVAMCQVWRHLSVSGTAGLIHPDSHFGGVKEGPLRAATYRYLRFHAHFINKREAFADIDRNAQFGIHVYGRPGEVDFEHMSWIFDGSTVVESLTHSGDGEVPGVKVRGEWDVRPHRSRLVHVDSALLAQWQGLFGDAEGPVLETPLLYPITTDEKEALAAFAFIERRLGDLEPRFSTGYHETYSKQQGLIRWATGSSSSLYEVVLQGPHFVGATPYSKQPNNPCKTNRDWSSWDLTTLPVDAMPVTNYARACDKEQYFASQDIWGDRPYTDYFRLAWREMVPPSNERSLFAALIPPGPAHIHAIRSMALPKNRDTALHAGFWASLPIDYLLRATGRRHLDVRDARVMPSPAVDHPLADPLLLRTLRLNCLTKAYAPLWEELFEQSWVADDGWVVAWPQCSRLNDVTQPWNGATPLRSDLERRAALVELDALVAVWLGISAEQLITIYQSRFPVLWDYESDTWFDANGRKIAGDHHTYGIGQTKEHFEQLVAYNEALEKDGPAGHLVPESYASPFYKADREAEYRQAHAVFSKRLQDAVDAGWRPK
ncbi:class I SAM-dependent DNA methyltransferase [Catellatospora chokoriensis]|uniref:site-specific DNA-methyltransferase (adenine-specific) n=1 Tax=Catellatospora chokoriensis TaxID=310353 RepID=A0A8J3KAE0_9ACTN|nr:class I SAM-dependent DNA methyltransferase [Catellatospora chokoriensis]GIF91509.1 restriction endonuclease subunit M [Catellatospora chokoriensis]